MDITNLNEIKKDHYYLKVVDDHLEVEKKNWFGRILIWLGIGSAAFKKVTKYMDEHKSEFTALKSSERDLLTSYFNKHTFSKYSSKALEILRITPPPQPQPKEPAPAPASAPAPAPVPVPAPGPNPPPAAQPVSAEPFTKEQINERTKHIEEHTFGMRHLYKQARPVQDFMLDIVESGSFSPTLGKHAGRANTIEGTQAAIGRMKTFLQAQLEKPIQHDIVYASIAPGQITDEIFPGFIFQAVSQNKKALTLIFDPDPYINEFRMEQLRLLRDIHLGYKAHTGQEGMPVEKFANMTLRQFVSGYPVGYTSLDELPDKPENASKRATAWASQAQQKELHDLFEQYALKVLREGKTLVLSFHSNFTLQEPPIQLYNKLAQEFPGKVHFLQGYGGYNLSTTQVIKAEDLKGRGEKKDVGIWKYHPDLKQYKL